MACPEKTYREVKLEPQAKEKTTTKKKKKTQQQQHPPPPQKKNPRKNTRRTKIAFIFSFVYWLQHDGIK